MHPVLFHFGPFVLRWYGAMMGLALFISIPLTTRFGERFGIAREPIESLALPFLVTLLVGARVGYVVSHPQEFLAAPLAIIRPPYAGLASHGAIAFGFVLLALWCRRRRIPIWRLTDAMTPAILVAIILVRWGNFMNGELYGDPTTLPWGIVFPGIPGGPRHPLQLYEMAGTGLILAWALRAAGRRPFDGFLFWSALVASSVLRFLLDLLRSEDRTALFLTWGQVAALALIVWGAWFLWAHGRRALRTNAGPT
ncbi:MAG: prolipoprotein diacylglyceryl transferase [Candidatus Dormibacteria bacterium]